MRPIVLFASVWACWSCAVAAAQSPEQRPTSLRDAGVITRAAPPPSQGYGGTSNQQPPSTTTGQMPAQMPPYPSAQARDPSPAFSDRAWTGSPSRTGSSARLTDSSDSTNAGVNTGEPNGSSHAPAVVSAQYTTGSAGTANSTPTRLVNHQNAVSGTATHEPKPLKPPTSASKSTDKGSTGTVQMFVSVLSSLAIVIGLILAAAWFYRKAAPKISGALPKQVVQVLGRTPLAPRQQLVLLRLGSKLILVSNLHGDVRAISEITDPLEVDRLTGLCEAAQPGSISESFRSVLHNMGRNG